MPNKAFAILLRYDDEDTGYLYFPIKRDHAHDYAGMPQFFGGTKNLGETDRETIAREMAEESNDKVTLARGPLRRVYQYVTAGGSTYNFYVTENFEGRDFLGPLEGNPEMKAIERFLVQRGQDDTLEDLLRSLHIVPSEAFEESATAEAFARAIRDSEADEEPAPTTPGLPI